MEMRRTIFSKGQNDQKGMEFAIVSRNYEREKNDT